MIKRNLNKELFIKLNFDDIENENKENKNIENVENNEIKDWEYFYHLGIALRKTGDLINSLKYLNQTIIMKKEFKCYFNRGFIK